MFEGWCIGASAQETVAEPINDLERAEDAVLRQWRGRVNEQLSAVYPALFDQIDRLIMLRPPSLECVIAWRTERKNFAHRLAEESGDASGVMDAAGIQRFVMHYERGNLPVGRIAQARRCPHRF